MSQENVEVLRRSFEAWNRNDSETLMACHAPDVVAVPPAEWPEAETGTSRDTLRHQFERAKDAWEEERVEVDEIRDLGDRVLAPLSLDRTRKGQSRRGRASRRDPEHAAWREDRTD